MATEEEKNLLFKILMEMTPEQLRNLFTKCSDEFEDEEFDKLAQDVVDAAIAESN